MQTQEINAIALSLPIPGFLGVFAADELPKRPAQSRFSFICNTDPASMPGTHWLAFNFTSPTHYEFFDSYGMPLNSSYASIVRGSPLLLSSTCSAARTKAVQSLNSNLCGQYCLFFLYQRLCNHKSFKWIFSHLFSSGPQYNDKLINSFSCNLLKYCFGRSVCAQYKSKCTQSCQCFLQWHKVY